MWARFALEGRLAEYLIVLRMTFAFGRLVRFPSIWETRTNLSTANPGTIGDTERDVVAWCTKSGRGTRTIPDGTLQGVNFVKTPDYVQVTGVGNFTSLNIPQGDGGGELDSVGADGTLLFGFLPRYLCAKFFFFSARGNPSEYMTPMGTGCRSCSFINNSWQSAIWQRLWSCSPIP